MKKSLSIATIFAIPLLVILALSALGVGWQTPVAAQTETEPTTVSERLIHVTGEGRIAAQPDTAVLRLGVQTEADTAVDALDDNNVRMQGVISATLGAGVAEADIQTQGLRLQPVYETGGSTTTETLTGYRASNIVEVTVRDLENLGALLDTAVEAGGNTIESIRFEISDRAALLEQAREAAMSDATAKAEQLTDLAGAGLGEVVTINEFGQSPAPVFAAEQAVADTAVPIQAGTQEIVSTVQVTWRIVP